jgi:hypothetical protein
VKSSVFVSVALVACSSVLTPRASIAQDVSGTVRDSVTGVPVRGAVVMILAGNREPVARRLSSSNGSFRISAGSGTLLRVIRIGYLPFEKPVSQLGTASIQVTLAPAGHMIAPVMVRSNSSCPQRSDQREALAYWSAATDALLAVVVAAVDSQHSGLLTQLLYTRELSRTDNSVLWQSTRRVVTGNVLPIRADRDPEDFVNQGYVITRANGATYYAPDPEVLLDSSFAATHCLSMRPAPRGDTTRIGVAFVPPSDRRGVSDIEGVLWLTRSPLSLHSFEFEYRGVPREVLELKAGGRLQFQTLSDGTTIISSWEVRSPRLRYVRGVSTDHLVAAELHETGGLIADGVLSDGTPWTVPLGKVSGVVSNLVTPQPVRGAVVTLDSTDHHVTTDASGRFFFEQLLPGPYVLRVRDSLAIHPMRVDSLGDIVPDTTAVMQVVTRTATRTVDVKVGVEASAEMMLPWRAPVLGCGKQTLPERRFVVVGVVLNAANRVVPNVPVRISWIDLTRGVQLETAIHVKADEGGSFIVCGIPSERVLNSQVIGRDGTVHTGLTRITDRHPDDGRKLPETARAIAIRIPGS